MHAGAAWLSLWVVAGVLFPNGRQAMAQAAAPEQPAPVVSPAAAPGAAAAEQEADSESAPMTVTREALAVTGLKLPSAQELHRWERHVRGFRREHNFAFSLGASSGEWLIKRFGTLNGRRFDSSGVVARFQYSFHLPLYGGFGYMLGSSGGYNYEAADKRKPFQPVPSYVFPGLLVGLVYNASPVVRLSLAAEAYLERHNGLRERSGEGEGTEIHITMTAYDAGAFLDLFYDLSWALRLEGHYRHLEYHRPLDAIDLPVNANIKKNDRWMGLGVVYHLL